MVDMKFKHFHVLNREIFHVEMYVVGCWNVAITFVYDTAMLYPMPLILTLLVKIALVVKRGARNLGILNVNIIVLSFVTEVSYSAGEIVLHVQALHDR